jgi:hypothetical protein
MDAATRRRHRRSYDPGRNLKVRVPANLALQLAALAVPAVLAATGVFAAPAALPWIAPTIGASLAPASGVPVLMAPGADPRVSTVFASDTVRRPVKQTADSVASGRPAQLPSRVHGQLAHADSRAQRQTGKQHSSDPVERGERSHDQQERDQGAHHHADGGQSDVPHGRQRTGDDGHGCHDGHGSDHHGSHDGHGSEHDGRDHGEDHHGGHEGHDGGHGGHGR